MRIHNFTYNGFFGEVEDTIADYTVEFKKWTRDPGIFIGNCSDGKERAIPTFALIDKNINLPEQPKEEMLFFGQASNSK